jgi:uncharacterized coiled-coil DUF342 family protein
VLKNANPQPLSSVGWAFKAYIADIWDDLPHIPSVLNPVKLLEKFNNKYDTLTDDQKQILKEYINSVDSTPDLRNFYNTKITELKSTLSKITKNIKDKATQVKITEVTKFLAELNKTDKVGDNNLVDLLRYYQLVNEIQIANGKQI